MKSALKDKWNHIPQAAKVSTAYAVCSILQRCMSFITLPLFTRLLTQEQYGQVTIFTSWQGILQVFLTLNLAYGSFSTAMIKFEKDRQGYISSVEGICVLLSCLFLIIYTPFRTLWNRLFELPSALIYLMVAEILCLTATQFWSGKKRFEFKYISVVTVTLFISFVSPVIQYLFVTHSVEKGYARIVGASVANMAVGGSLFFINLKRGKKFFDREYWKYALGFNLPLLAYYLSQIIFNQSDRIMISHMVGKDKAAIYGVAYTLAMVLTFVLNAINNSYVPWYYGKIKEGRQQENRRISLFIALLMSVLLSGVIWFAPEIITIMASPKYAEAIYVVPPVAISLLLLFYSQLFINVEFYYEEKKKLVWASIGSAVANLVLNWIFIRRFGYVAAAYTTLTSYVIFAFCNYIAMKQVLAEQGIEDVAYDYKGLLIILAGFSVLTVIGVLLYRWLAARIAVAVLVCICIVIKRDQFIQYYKMIKRRS